RPGSGAPAEPARAAELDRVHGAVAVVPPAVLGAAEVETATAVEQRGRRDLVDPLRLGTGWHALGVEVAVADRARGGVENLHPVDGVAVHGHRQSHGVRTDIRLYPRDRHVVVLGTLVVDLGYRARRPGTERDLRGSVGVATG